MFEHNQQYIGGDRAILVGLEMPGISENDLHEFQELVSSAGVISLAFISGKRAAPDVKYFVGTGKLEEIKLSAEHFDANVILFNHSLQPSQVRNLTKFLERRVVDRTGLILDIFAQRAQSFEGKLQVELAQLQHISTRLVRMWTHLERQRGGIGLRGPGETQLESDRRMITTRIQQIEKKLHKVNETRRQGRLLRQRSGIPTIALVGYTNAGKSSLFNQLTGAGVYQADQLFATLDPTHRALDLPQLGKVILIDTVGFITNLPHELIAAFQSTLQESVEADLLLEIIDCADPERLHKINEVAKVLDTIGAGHIPRIQVFNKIDLMDQVSPHMDYIPDTDITIEATETTNIPSPKVARVWLSAEQGLGIDLLCQAISQRFQNTHLRGQITLPPHAAKLRAQLFSLHAVIDEHTDESGNSIMTLFIATSEAYRLAKHDQNAILLAPILALLPSQQW